MNANTEQAIESYGLATKGSGAVLRHKPFAFICVHLRTWLLFVLLSPGLALAIGDKTPTPPPSPVGVGGLFQIVLALAFVLGLILGLAWLLRRMGAVPQAAAGAMRVLGGVAIGQRERIVLVQVGETQLVVGVGPGQIRTLHVLDKPVAVPPAGGGPGGDFAQRLAAALRRGGKPS